MDPPKISICLPNLNNRRYLPERFETIFAQTERDWELLVYDSHSDDGAWEFICEAADRDGRIRAWQGPREGVLGSWTPCLKEARGQYVYIATSDDTMPPDCLASLAAALDAAPECDVAHCRLRVIDGDGQDIEEMNRWWAERSVFARSSGEWLDRPHVRKVPFDGLLHLAGESVLISVTQLLVRRSLFDKIGYFSSQWGPVGDFNWNMRAGLVANSVYVPATWGGWRVHGGQATDPARRRTPEHLDRIEDMIDDAFGACRDLMPPPTGETMERVWMPVSRDHRMFDRRLAATSSYLARQWMVARSFAAGSPAARSHVMSKISGRTPWPKSAPEMIMKWLDRAGAGSAIAPVPKSW